jgi:8-oxo-dGTP pyrophosphatase MutT (NUDIX family)
MTTMSEEVIPVPAASVIVVRDTPFEVLMLRRHAKSSFMPNAWVFPGGITEESDHELAAEVSDGSLLASMRITGIRETFEESGVWLGGELADLVHKRRRLLAGTLTMRQLLSESHADLESLVWTSRWITPVGVPKRFDTYFFLARVSHAAEASPQEDEAVDAVWIHPADALRRNATGAMQMVFPTLRTLESMRDFHSSAPLIASRRGAIIEPIQPVLVDGKPTLP